MSNRLILPVLLSEDDNYEVKSIKGNNLYEVVDKKTNKKKIIKIILIDKFEKDDVKRYLSSVNLLNSLKVEELVIYTKIVSENNYIYMIMPKYSKCLNEIKNPTEYFSDSGVFDIIMPICKGTMKIHENGLINGNINPFNILFNEENEVKLSDYCKIELYKNRKDKMIVDIDKLSYMSPEVIENKEVSDKSDIWSIGCVLYYLLTNKRIFEGKSILEVLNKIMRCEYDKLECEFSETLNELLKKVIVVESNDRLSIVELINELIKINSFEQIPSVPFLNNSIPLMKYNPGIIGIDLGISSSVCGIYSSRYMKISILQLNNGKEIIPNYIYYNPNNDEVVVGESAVYRSRKAKLNVIYDSQKFIGLSYDDPIVQEGMKKWPFKIINDNGIPKIELVHNNKTVHLSSSDVTSEIVKYMKGEVDSKLNHNRLFFTKAVITYPLHFTQNQIFETKLSCERANVEVIDLIPETVAAIIAYLYEKNIKDDKYFLIYNFTKSCFDVTICDVDYDKKIIKIIGYENDLNLGGDSITNALVDYYLNEYVSKTGESRDSLKSNVILNLLRECEKAKIQLSSSTDSSITSSLLEDNDIDSTLTRAKFNNICKNILDKTMNMIDNVLSKCNIKPYEISYVIQSGGSSKIFEVKELLYRKFGSNNICRDIKCEDVFARGATVYGNVEEYHYNIANCLDISYVNSGVTDLVNRGVVGIYIGIEYSVSAIYKNRKVEIVEEYDYTFEHIKKIIHFSGSSITSKIIQKIKSVIDSFAGHNPVTKAVITYPLFFTEKQITETKISCERANVEVIDLIPETVAAIIAYLYEKNIKDDKYFLIYNFTKSCFDVTICDVDYDKKIIKIIGYENDLNLGGDSITNALVDYYLNEYVSKTGKSRDSLNHEIISRLFNESEKARRRLSWSDSGNIDSSILKDNSIDSTLTRAKYEDICKSIFNKIMNMIDNVINNCNIQSYDKLKVIISGLTGYYEIEKLFKEKFGKDNICVENDLELFFARGAAAYGNIEEYHYKFEKHLE